MVLLTEHDTVVNLLGQIRAELRRNSSDEFGKLSPVFIADVKSIASAYVVAKLPDLILYPST